ncbi:MAG: GumC family protein [Planctomycetota bacterium]|jgi:uncharacterized protein involved in exopolysaccharide biosynthesis
MSGFQVVFGNYIRRALAYRWIVLVPTVLVFALVTFNVTIQPDTYESYAVLMPPIAKPGDDNTRRDTHEVARDMFLQATERLLSTNTLMVVAERHDPYPALREHRGMAAVIEKLRKNIRIELNRHTGSITVYGAHREGERPDEMSADMVNTLTSIFVDSQKEALEDKAAKLEKFLLQEHARVRQELERTQKRVDDFRMENAGSLPDDVETNREQVDRLRQQIVDIRQNQRMYMHDISRLNREVARLDTELAYAAESGTASVAVAIQGSERLLSSLQLELARLRVEYHEDNHKIIEQKVLIEGVKQQIEELRNTDSKTSEKREQYLQYLQDENRKQIARYEEEVRTIDSTVASLDKGIEDAQQRMLVAARIESRYESLERDVEDVLAKYHLVQERLITAQNRRKYGEYDSSAPIQVEQSAFVPIKPAAPDRLITSLVGLLIGLGVGVGLAVMRHRLDASYRQADDLRALMPGAVLVTIPEVRTSGVRIGRALMGVMAGLVLAGVFAATVAVLGIQVGWWGEPEMIRALIEMR